MEIWKDVVGYEGLYQVSNLGNVKSLDRMVNHSKGGYAKKKGKIKIFMYIDWLRKRFYPTLATKNMWTISMQ